MAVPTITFDTGGSDTAASGSGHPTTAVTGGVGTATSDGLANSTITFSNTPDLSGVDATGLSVFWANGSGRQFTKIIAVNNAAHTIQVEDAITNANVSAASWAIGGNRITFDNVNSRKLFTADVKAGWTIVTTGTQGLVSVIACVGVGDATNGPVQIQGSSGAIRSVTINTNATILTINSGGIYVISNLKFACTNATRTSAIGLNLAGANVLIKDCVLGDATNTLNNGVSCGGAGNYTEMINCEITATTSHGYTSSQGGYAFFDNCWIHGATGSGKGINLSANCLLEVFGSLITGNASNGIAHTGTPDKTTGRLTVVNSTIDNNAADGLDISSVTGIALGCILTGNNFTRNTGFGVKTPSLFDQLKGFADYNCFGAAGDSTQNTSGTYSNGTAGAHDLTSTSPQYTAVGSNNWQVGTNVKAKAYPDAAVNIGLNSATLSFVDIGAAQRQEAASGGGGIFVANRRLYQAKITQPLRRIFVSMPTAPGNPVEVRRVNRQYRTAYPSVRRQLLPLPISPGNPIPTLARRIAYRVVYPAVRRLLLPLPIAPGTLVPAPARRVQIRQYYPQRRAPLVIQNPPVTTYVPVRIAPRQVRIPALPARRLLNAAVFQSQTTTTTNIIIRQPRTVR